MKKNKIIILAVFLISFISCNTGYSADKKEELQQYLGKVNPILINVQTTSRNISMKLLSLDAAVKQMEEYLDSLRSIKPPRFMAKQHKMILLAFKKMKMGFYLLFHGDRERAVSMTRRGAGLLRMAAKDMVDLASKEGLIKESNKQQGASEEEKQQEKNR